MKKENLSLCARERGRAVGETVIAAVMTVARAAVVAPAFPKARVHNLVAHRNEAGVLDRLVEKLGCAVRGRETQLMNRRLYDEMFVRGQSQIGCRPVPAPQPARRCIAGPTRR